MSGGSDDAFWCDPGVVARFGAREPDIHLLHLLAGIGDARGIRALDLGCAAGRNVVALLDHGADVVALDASPAMCAATRERAGGRAVRGVMDHLPLPGRSVDLVVALGVYHQARSDVELARAFAETARVLSPGGLLLLSVFARDMLGPDATPVAGQRFVHEDPRRGLCVRLTEEQLVEELGREGFVPRIPVKTRRKRTEREERVSLVAVLAKVGFRDDGPERG